MSTTQKTLIDGWCQQFPSHSVGDLRFGQDGALYVTGGDGASFNNADWGQYGGTTGVADVPKNPCGDPPAGAGGTQTPPTARGGALRAQSIRRPAGPHPNNRERPFSSSRSLTTRKTDGSVTGVPVRRTTR